MQDQEKNKDDLRTCRSGRLTILELMTVLAVLGILLTWILRQFLTI